MQQQSQHNREIIHLVNEGVYDNNGRIEPTTEGFLNSEETFSNSDLSVLNDLLNPQKLFRYGRMFQPTTSKPPSNEELMLLGEAMVQEKEFKDDNSGTPAGYTFLGQFIGHDLSFDVKSNIVLNDVLKPVELLSSRSPQLELDSLYGLFSDSENKFTYYPGLYDGIRFRIGKTVFDTRRPDARSDTENDLPRVNKIAVIGDERNDENLGIAQVHVAFLRFHNAVVDHLEKILLIKKDELFETARKIVITYYQQVILSDYLPKIVDNDILQEVISWAEPENSRLNWLDEKEDPFIPVEFSVAAFRLGHSLLQDAYDWNNIFNTPDENGTFAKLFSFTGKSGLDGHNQVTGSWAIDWRRFFDFSDYGIDSVPINKSRKIDTLIAHTFSELHHFILLKSPFRERNLASRNLIRGKAVLLPTGEETCEFLKNKLKGRRVLTEVELQEGKQKEILKKFFCNKTPLWYYILKEAEVLNKGEKLGPVGSFIVAETLVKLIERSNISIFKNDWKDEFSIVAGKNPAADKVTMADLIKFADSENNPLINPLG